MVVVTNETIEEDEDEEDDVSIEKKMRCSIPDNYQRDDKRPASMSPMRCDISDFTKNKEKQLKS